MKLPILSLWVGTGGVAARRVRSRSRRGAAGQKKRPKRYLWGRARYEESSLKIWLLIEL